MKTRGSGRAVIRSMDPLKGARLLEERFGGCTPSDPIAEGRADADAPSLPLWQWVAAPVAPDADD